MHSFHSTGSKSIISLDISPYLENLFREDLVEELVVFFTPALTCERFHKVAKSEALLLSNSSLYVGQFKDSAEDKIKSESLLALPAVSKIDFRKSPSEERDLIGLQRRKLRAC